MFTGLHNNSIMRSISNRVFLCSIVSFLFGASQPVYSQVSSTSLAPIRIAQTATPPSLTPTDVTPVNIGRERELLKPGLTYYLFQNLPAKLWFNATVETSQRYESNVFFSRTRYISDYVYRILPNVSVGYELFKKFSIYSNYFMIKDVFVGHNQLTFPTTQSLSMGMRREFTISPRTNLQLDFQARELWQTTNLHQFDFIPATTITHFVNAHTIVYANMLLQLRGAHYFTAPTREIDPFYTIGVLHTKGNWMFTAVGTLVTNFRNPPFNFSIPPFSNNSIIADFEVAHPLPKIPYLVGFIRAEPIWNWNGNGLQGISGMDFRLFSGVRMSVAKPTYGSSIKRLKQQLHDFNMGPAGTQNGLPPITPGQSEEPEPVSPTPQFGPKPPQLSVPQFNPPVTLPTPSATPLHAVPESLPLPAVPATKQKQVVPPATPKQQPANTPKPEAAPKSVPAPVVPKQPAVQPVAQPAAQPKQTDLPKETPAAAPTTKPQQPSSKESIETSPKRTLDTVPEFAPENY